MARSGKIRLMPGSGPPTALPLRRGCLIRANDTSNTQVRDSCQAIFMLIGSIRDCWLDLEWQSNGQDKQHNALKWEVKTEEPNLECARRKAVSLSALPWRPCSGCLVASFLVHHWEEQSLHTYHCKLASVTSVVVAEFYHIKFWSVKLHSSWTSWSQIQGGACLGLIIGVSFDSLSAGQYHEVSLTAFTSMTRSLWIMEHVFTFPPQSCECEVEWGPRLTSWCRQHRFFYRTIHLYGRHR